MTIDNSNANSNSKKTNLPQAQTQPIYFLPVVQPESQKGKKNGQPGKHNPYILPPQTPWQTNGQTDWSSPYFANFLSQIPPEIIRMFIYYASKYAQIPQPPLTQQPLQPPPSFQLTVQQNAGNGKESPQSATVQTNQYDICFSPGGKVEIKNRLTGETSVNWGDPHRAALDANGKVIAGKKAKGMEYAKGVKSKKAKDVQWNESTNRFILSDGTQIVMDADGPKGRVLQATVVTPDGQSVDVDLKHLEQATYSATGGIEKIASKPQGEFFFVGGGGNSLYQMQGEQLQKYFGEGTDTQAVAMDEYFDASLFPFWTANPGTGPLDQWAKMAKAISDAKANPPPVAPPVFPFIPY